MTSCSPPLRMMKPQPVSLAEEQQAHAESLHCELSASATERFSPSCLIRYQTCVGYCFLIGLLSAPLGWDLGTVGGYTSSAVFQARFGHSSLVIGAIVASFNLGCAFGGLTLGRFGDTHGRCRGMAIALVVYLLGVTVQAVSAGAEVTGGLLAGRLLTGLGLGSLNVLAPMLIAECAPCSIRGICVSFYQVNAALFIFLGQSAMVVLSRTASLSPVMYLVPVGVQFVWGVTGLIGCLTVIPESPKYLARANQPDAARQTLSRLLAHNPDGPEVEEELAYLHLSTDPPTARPPLKELLTSLHTRGMVLMGVLIMMFQQLSGINYFFYYGNTVFALVGMEDPYACSAYLGFVNLLLSILSIATIERYGRRGGLLAGALFMAAFMFAYSATGHWHPFAPKLNGALMIAFTCAFIASFALTWGPIPNLLMNEVFPTATKQASMAMAGLTNNLCNFAIALATPTLSNHFGFGLGGSFALFSLGGAAYVSRFVPETKGATFGETQRFFRGPEAPQLGSEK